MNAVNVREILLEMRRSRMGLIQTPDQLRFSYAAIIDGAKRLPLNSAVINSYTARMTLITSDDLFSISILITVTLRRISMTKR